MSVGLFISRVHHPHTFRRSRRKTSNATPQVVTILPRTSPNKERVRWNSDSSVSAAGVDGPRDGRACGRYETVKPTVFGRGRVTFPAVRTRRAATQMRARGACCVDASRPRPRRAYNSARTDPRPPGLLLRCGAHFTGSTPAPAAVQGHARPPDVVVVCDPSPSPRFLDAGGGAPRARIPRFAALHRAAAGRTKTAVLGTRAAALHRPPGPGILGVRTPEFVGRGRFLRSRNRFPRGPFFTRPRSSHAPRTNMLLSYPWSFTRGKTKKKKKLKRHTPRSRGDAWTTRTHERHGRRIFGGQQPSAARGNEIRRIMAEDAEGEISVI